MEWLESISEGLLGTIERGEIVWWVLGILLFVSAAAIIYEALAGSVRLVAPAGLRVHLFEHLKHGRRIQALQQAQKSSSQFGAIARSALRLPEHSPSFITYAVTEETLNHETALLRARVSLIGGLAVASLLIGTVGALGGMLSIMKNAASSVSSATLAAEAVGGLKAAVAAGILAALVTGFYYVFLTRLHIVEALLWSESERLVAMLLGIKPDEQTGDRNDSAEEPSEEQSGGEEGEGPDKAENEPTEQSEDEDDAASGS